MPIKKHCEKCGKEFSVPPSRISARFCSHPCSITYGANNPTWKGGLVEKKCLHCGKPTFAKPSHLHNNAGNYCSNSCKAKGSGQAFSKKCFEHRIVKHCNVCNIEIRVKPSHKHIEGTYCSKKCMAIGYKTKLIGMNNPNFRHGKSHIASHYIRQRKLALGSYDKSYPSILYKLQKGKCANCSQKLYGKYDVDHIQPIAKGGTNYQENIQLLCKSCNCKKQALDPFDWANRNGKLL